MFPLRVSFLVLTVVPLLVACDSGDSESPDSSQTVAEDVAACSGIFICSSSHNKGNEYYLSKNGDLGCGFFTSTGTRHQILQPGGHTAEGAQWHQTERGFEIEYSSEIKTNCVASSKYVEGEVLEDKKSSGDTPKNCRGSGHFCGAGSVCCSYSCSLSTNTCN